MTPDNILKLFKIFENEMRMYLVFLKSNTHERNRLGTWAKVIIAKFKDPNPLIETPSREYIVNGSLV